MRREPKMKMTELLPLNVYPFTVVMYCGDRRNIFSFLKSQLSFVLLTVRILGIRTDGYELKFADQV